jgi:molybdopterin converting factor small subunit
VSVTVRLFAAARDAAGGAQESAAPGWLNQVLAELVTAHGGPDGALAGVLQRCTYLVDGVRADLDTAVPDGAVVDVLPPFAGG